MSADQRHILLQDFLLGSVVFHYIFHLLVEGYLVTLIDRFFGTQFANEYMEVVRTVCLLFVPDERGTDAAHGENGLVINRSEHVPLPRVLFVEPYSVQEIQAMKLWDHLVGTYAMPFVYNLLVAVFIAHIACLINGMAAASFGQSDGKFYLFLRSKYLPQCAIISYFVHSLLPYIWNRLWSKMIKLYNIVRDDMYLIGRKLRNLKRDSDIIPNDSD